MFQYRSFFLILLTIGVILSGFMIILLNVQSTTLKINDHGFDGFISDMVAIKMDKGGAARTTLLSPNARYYRSTDDIIVDKPKMMITPDRLNPGSWAITANQAIVFLVNKTIRLYGDVHVTRNQNKHLPKTNFTTSSLTIEPYQNKAYTHQEVTIIQPGNKVKAKGLRANLKTGVISLISNANGEFNPNAN